ncbi:hypothetical protein Asp14428_33230 [Actinoplanes sp. NBRC 14428]|nr:hypothetical protein Asp14428_33230 [Actinoplanes sp. NBRC 14428]
MQAPADTQGRITWTVSADSRTSRAHQHAAKARTDWNRLAESATTRLIRDLAVPAAG